MEREFIRFNIEGEVVLKPQDGSSREIKANLVDISFTGISVFSILNLEVDTLVNFDLATRIAGEQVSGEGKIRYVKPELSEGNEVFKTGIAFTSVDKNMIKAIINRLQLEYSSKARKKSD